jgi:hypothetical protein
MIRYFLNLLYTEPRVKYFIIVFALLFIPHACPAQEIMKGIVVDSATFTPLPYVVVQVKNKNIGTTTDEKGNFSIYAAAEDTLIFSLLGYERLEFPLFGYEASVIRMAERATMLRSVTINDARLDNPYEGMFDEQNAARLKKSIPFYYARSRKDKIKAGWWREENNRVQTYVDVVINNPETKAGLMQKYGLSEEEYYAILTKFNEKYYNVMYYLSVAELTSFLNRFFESQELGNGQ